MAENPTDENALSTRIARKADNLKYFILGGVAVLVAAVGIFFHIGNARAREQAANADAVFRSFVEIQGKTPAEAAPELAATAKKYAGQPAGVQVAVHALGASLDAKQYAGAEAIGLQFIKDYPESPLIPRFRVAIAQSLIEQGKTQAAIDSLREFVATAGPETLAEAKLALAQALEAFAGEAKDNPEEYARRLEAAQAEYTDITSRARIDSPLQRGFWPQVLTLTADYALVQIKDRLAGHVLAEPVAAAPEASAGEATPAEREALESLRPPGAGAAEEAPAEEETEKETEEETPETPAAAE